MLSLLRNEVNFSRDIKPIFEASCLRCHGPEKPRSGFRLDNRQSALKGGENGVDIVPGDSTNSALIRYVAGLDEQIQMPPAGKGEPLTSNQVALLRKWIDQGVAWDSGPSEPTITMIQPMVSYTGVSGDKGKFREHYWQKEGWNGGLEQFELGESLGPDGTFRMYGHFLRNDYELHLERDKPDAWFVHGGWQQYWKYYDDIGGYNPLQTPSVTSLDRDLHLNIGRAWADIGLTLPDWPRIVVGYEYQYRHGEEATLQWGNTNANGRNINPASQMLKEDTHIVKFDLDYDLYGTRIEDSFRGEFYRLNTSSTNAFYSDLFGNLNSSRVNENYEHFQGANSIRLERKFTDWLFGSAGYLFSKLDGSTTVGVSTANQSAFGFDNNWQSQGITLERESQVGNINALLGPWAGFTVSTGVQAEWTSEQGFGNDVLSSAFTGTPATIFPVQTISDYDTSLVEENVALRYTAIPFTSLFAEGSFRQEWIGQDMSQVGDASIFFSPEFALDTRFTSMLYDYRVGFNTSPLSWVSLGAHYRRYDDRSHYDHTLNEQPIGNPGVGYPGFITARDLLTDEVETKLTLRPLRWLKTTLTYKLLQTDYATDTDSASFGPAFIISPGGALLAGQSDAQVYSGNLTVTPWQRLYLSATFSWQHSRTETANNGSPSVVPYRGDTLSGLASATFVLDKATDLIGSYSFSSADFLQDNFADGLPTGMRYQQQGIWGGITRHFGPDVLAKLQYGYLSYNEPSSGGAANYHAHSLLAMLTLRLP